MVSFLVKPQPQPLCDLVLSNVSHFPPGTIMSMGASPPLTAINSSVESTSSVRFAKFFMIISLKDF